MKVNFTLAVCVFLSHSFEFSFLYNFPPAGELDFTAFGPELDALRLGIVAMALPNLIKQAKTLIEVYPIREGPTPHLTRAKICQTESQR